MSRQKDDVKLIELYKEKTGETLVDMKEVALWAIEKGHRKKPVPKSPEEILASQLADSIRQETKKDNNTGDEYRVYHAVPSSSQGKQHTLWVNIKNATRSQMQKSLTNRRNQIIGDATQLSIDADYWNKINPKEKPIQIELDFSLDVEWNRNADKIKKEKA
ncbi:MAG: hypothetical protein LBH40_00235 [Alphaproteobacteria bacterium]|jgi:hypothetical protein|nr:hypothetical protein [Alphaproteobacteria bacterium]